MSQPDKISRNLFITRGLYLRLTLSKDKDVTTWWSDYENSNSTTRYINMNPILNLGMNPPPGTDWDRSFSVMIHNKNQHVILRQMKRFIEALYEGKMFDKDSNDKIIIYGDIASEHTELIQLPYTDNNAILLKPHVITDQNNVTYEGCMLCINKPSNFVELYMDDLEALYNVLSKVDFFLYSQVMFNSISNEEDRVYAPKTSNKIKW